MSSIYCVCLFKKNCNNAGSNRERVGNMCKSKSKGSPWGYNGLFVDLNPATLLKYCTAIRVYVQLYLVLYDSQTWPCILIKALQDLASLRHRLEQAIGKKVPVLGHFIRRCMDSQGEEHSQARHVTHGGKKLIICLEREKACSKRGLTEVILVSCAKEKAKNPNRDKI